MSASVFVPDLSNQGKPYAFQHLLPLDVLKWAIAAVMLTFGIYRLFRASHPRGAGMRVGGRNLVVWSFLMASAHGAGLMLIPVLWSHPAVTTHHTIYGPMTNGDTTLSTSMMLAAIFVHTAAMLLVAGILALVFFELYEVSGLKVLRRTWVNFDLLWAIALLIAAVAVLLG